MAKDDRPARTSDNVTNLLTKSTTAKATSGKTLPAHDLIGRKLREYYDEVAQQPVPDKFAALLSELEKKSSEKKHS
jgi:DNA-binding protein Fis